MEEVAVEAEEVAVAAAVEKVAVAVAVAAVLPSVPLQANKQARRKVARRKQNRCRRPRLQKVFYLCRRARRLRRRPLRQDRRPWRPQERHSACTSTRRSHSGKRPT